MTEVNPFLYTRGPHNAEVLFVGEAWSQAEAQRQLPFQGGAGIELSRMLKEAGLDEAKLLFANVIDAQPFGNDFKAYLYSNDEAKRLGLDKNAWAIKPELEAGTRKLHALIQHCNPKLIIGAGNVPLQTLTEHATLKTSKGYKYPSGILSWRGSQTRTRLIGDKTYNYLPLVHPAAILRDWSNRSITVHDLRSRAARYLRGQLAWEAPNYNFIPQPTFDQVAAVLNNLIARVCYAPTRVAVDLETTAKRWISVVGLADESVSLCIPFFYFTETGLCVNYWNEKQEELIWQRLRFLLNHPNCRIIGQNFIYDTQYLQRSYGIDAIVAEDTMVMHHLCFPGTPKGLHRLASLYCDHYCYWKDESEEWNASELKAQDMWYYNCKDTRYTYDCATVLRAVIKQLGKEALYEERQAAWRLAKKMTIRGCHTNLATRRDFTFRLFNDINRLNAWLDAAVPEAIGRTAKGGLWVTSAKAVAFILYDVIGVRPVFDKKTGSRTTNDAALNEIMERPECEWLKPLLERLAARRSAGIFKKNFLDSPLNPAGRMVTQFNIAHPETFRWSSRSNAFDEGTNNQNMPKVKD